MADNTSTTLFGVIIEGIKDRFIAVSGGSLILVIIYYFCHQHIDGLLIKSNSEFVYVGVITLILAATFIVFMIQFLLELFILPILKRKNDIENFKIFLARLTPHELNLIKDEVLQAPSTSRLSNGLIKVKNLREVENLIILNKATPHVQQTDGSFTVTLNVRYEIGENFKKFELLNKAIEKNKA